MPSVAGPCPAALPPVPALPPAPAPGPAACPGPAAGRARRSGDRPAANVLSITKLAIMSLSKNSAHALTASPRSLPLDVSLKSQARYPGSATFSFHPQHSALLPLRNVHLTPLNLNRDQDNDAGYSPLQSELTSTPQLPKPS